MYALYEESGKFHAGRILSRADATMQVELATGRRVKLKNANVLLTFEQPGAAELLDSAQTLAGEIDLDLVWEAAPDDDFGFDLLAGEYFGDTPGPVQRAAMAMRLFEMPHYFHRRGKGQFRKAPEDILKQALVAIERKRQQQLEIDAWAGQLAQGQCPVPIREQLYKLLFKPDKNGPEYKAVVAAAQRTHKSPLELFQQAGAIDSPYQFHWRRFLFEHFPRGTAFPELPAPALPHDLPLADVRAFSIDDSSTTEIDDALSVTGLGTGTVTLGVHIAVPGLAITPGDALDQVARERCSTVYMPGHKITMLPDDVVAAYTLREGAPRPALSLYLTVDEASLEIGATRTVLEQVPIEANLRHDQLDAQVTEASLTGQAPADYPFAPELGWLFRLARHLKSQREVIRGKPENFTRPDYTFRLLRETSGEPAGDERVAIELRRRGAPLDLLVAEAMILANSTWGGWLNDLGVPGIYRSQASMAPGVKVRMGTRAQPHAGMGVRQYSWATSPLRRYVDLVNQWQLIACARHGRTAALAAPFRAKDADLFSIISGFEAAHAAYGSFQSAIERYWTLRYLQQEGWQELDASVMKEGLVRADVVPLVFRALGAESLGRGAHVRVRLSGLDELTLDVHGSVVGRVDTRVEDAPTADEGGDGDGDDDTQPMAGPIALAIDVQETDQDPASVAGS